jgi:uncharacterized protein YkwD
MPSHRASAAHPAPRRRWLLTGVLAATAVVLAGGGYLLTHGTGSPSLSQAAADSGGTACHGTGPRSPAAGQPSAAHPTPATSACGRPSPRPSHASSDPVASTHPATPHPTPTPSDTPSRKHRPATPAPTATPGPTATPVPAPTTGAADARAAASVLAAVNQARARAGLPTYTIIGGLEVSAGKHNHLMASGCGLSHQCPGEPPLGDRETAAGVHWTAAGENIGEGGPVTATVAAITQLALALTRDMLGEKPPNDGHRLNLLSSTFTHIGIAVYHDSRGTVWMTQDFSN